MRTLGKGGFGATFLACDEALPGNPSCVIKQLRPSADAPHILDMARDLFQREAKILGKIGNHPQLPRLLDYFEKQQEFFLVQEYIKGATLQQEVKRGGPFIEEGVKQFLTEILPMIQYVHSNQVIHRDIKPANIIRREQDKKLVLIDFGAVKDKVSPTKATSSDQTALTAYAIGTPGYAPPEQMAMRPVYASDIYALGVTCIYLLSGKSPKDLDYDHTTGEMLWQKQVSVSEHFAQVLCKMLEMSVRHRYQSIDAILRDLDLEPYMDSLARNMAFQSPVGESNGLQNSGPLSSGGSASGGSPSARMAAAIRARRERSLSRSGGGSSSLSRGSMTRLQGSAPFSRNAATTPQRHRASQNKPFSQKQLTSKDIKQMYAKGHRDFSMRTLSNLDLPKSNLSGINFTQSKLCRANFQGAELTQASFGRADLTHAILRNTRLSRAYFNYANLEGVDCRGADLSYACLSNANLRGVNFCGADLTGATISDKQLAMARTNWSTVFPNGRRGIL